MSEKIKIFIIISVLLNILLAGVVVGGVIKHRPHGNPMMNAIEESSLPKERKDAIKAQLAEIFPRDANRWEDMKKSREETLALLTAEKFDADAYQKALDKMFAARSNQQQIMSQKITALASTLNQEERKALAEAFRKMRPPRRENFSKK